MKGSANANPFLRTRDRLSEVKPAHIDQLKRIVKARRHHISNIISPREETNTSVLSSPRATPRIVNKVSIFDTNVGTPYLEEIVKTQMKTYQNQKMEKAFRSTSTSLGKFTKTESLLNPGSKMRLRRRNISISDTNLLKHDIITNEP